ncbi:MAG: hypothetical protein JSS81_30205 [Acidobacteria bacterium]|nr:hypothetical protein [Acidobacteriota bacterium]
MRNKFNLIVAVAALVVIGMACNASFTTANISSLKFGKNDKADPETTSFNVGEKVNAVATVSNSMSKTKVKFKVFFENVSGQDKGKEAGATDVDLPSSGTAIFYFNPNAPGDYKVEATLVDESGKEIDKKSGTVNVKGTAAVTEPAKVSPDSDKSKDADDKEDK